MHQWVKILKFTKDARTCMGVCMRQKIEGEIEKEMEGVRLPFFDYTGKEVLSIKNYEQKIKEEIDRVRSLTDGRTSGWIISTRTGDFVYEEDAVIRLKRVGKITNDKLEKAGVTKVKQIALIRENEFDEFANKTKLTMNTIKSLHAQAIQAKSGSQPPDINYLSSPNPYLERYGASWEEQIKQVRYMTKFVSIKDLVIHIHDKTKEAYKGTKYEDTYLFYHDALITMTDKDCIDWMEREGIRKRWIRPELGLNDEIVIVDTNGKATTNKRYKGRPVGDCPEAMPLDNSLFRDLRCSFDTHVVLTCMLPQDDARRFSKATPKIIIKALKRLWDPETGVVPSSNRIIQDIKRLKENLLLVIEADGAVVPGVVDRNGHRNVYKVGRKYWPRKANPRALSIEELNLHPDCQEVVDQLKSAEWENFCQQQTVEI